MSVFGTIANYFQVFPFVFKRDFTSGVYFLYVQCCYYYHIFRKSTFHEFFDMQYRKNPQSVMLIHDNVKWTFEDVFKYSNQVANVFHNQGLVKGDEVVLNMEARPECIGIALGLSRIGAITAFINSNLKGSSLIHCINNINAKAIIFDHSTEKVLNSVFLDIKNSKEKKIFFLGDVNNEKKGDKINLSELLRAAPSKKLLFKHQGLFSDVVFYIYTSGTTGLPKAAIIKHSRLYLASVGFVLLGNFNKKDGIYLPLPLYHFAALMCIGISILTGCSCTIRHKFSASQFWKEYMANKCTSSIFIGELCRFLLAQPPSLTDSKVSIRVMLSIGLRPIIWKDFVKRFNVKNVIEMYGSTEGNTMLINFDNTPGAIGFLPKIYPKFLLNIFYPTKLAKVNTDTGELIREKTGFCSEAKEVGMIVSRIRGKNSLLSFEGYTDKEETAKKIANDVFQKGDRYFVSGDLVKIDKLGYIYFKDRIGDTFRWKGENVSTNEIEALIAKSLGNRDVAVFGVEIPNCEGKIGMAAIVQHPNNSIDLSQLLINLKNLLPSYALPHFIRLISELQFTGTMKINKVALKKEGYNINLVSDPIYFLDNVESQFKLLDENIYQKITNSQFCF